jgi:hypothetical protein
MFSGSPESCRDFFDACSAVRKDKPPFTAMKSCDDRDRVVD